MAEPAPLPTEERVNLVAPDGSKVNVPISQAQAAIDSGHRIASEGEVEAEKEREFRQSTGEQAKTVAEGVFRGVSLGFGEPVLTGISSAEDVKARKEASPGLALGAEAVGAIAPLFATGGTGALATGARAVGAAPRAVAAVGGAAERGAASLLGKGIFGRAGSMATGGAIEGAVVGAGQEVSRAVLNDDELTGEMVAAGMGHGALLGGLAGTAFGAGIGAAQKAGQLVTGAGREVAGRARGILPTRQVAGEAADAAGESFAAKFTRQQKAVRELDDVQQGQQKAIRVDGDRREEIFDGVTNELNIGNKLRSVRQSIDEDQAAGVLVRSADEALDDAQEMVSRLRKQLDDVDVHSNNFEPRELGAARGLKKFVVESDHTLRKMAVEGADRASVFSEMDRLKRRVGKVQDRMGGRAVSGPDEVATTLGATLRGEYDQMAGHLVDPSIYGRAATGIQSADNAAWSNWFDTRDAYRKMFLTDAGGARTATGFDQVEVMSPESIGSLVKGMGRAENAQKEEIFRRSIDATDQLLEQLGKSHGVGPKSAKLLAEHSSLSQRMGAGLETAAETSAAARAQRQLLEDLRGVPLMEGAARAAVSAVEGIAKLNGMRQQATTVSGKITKAVKAAVSGTKKGARKAVSAVEQQAAREPRAERFDKAVTRVNAGVDNPTGIAEAIAARNGSHAVTSAVVGTVVRGQQFLKAKMPAPLMRESERQPDIPAGQRVSNSEMSRWLRYVEAVENPMSVVDALEDGTLRREGAEALRVVHPKMYSELKQRVDLQVADESERIPRSRLTQLSILFDEAYHPSMAPEFLMSMQQNWATAQEEEQQGDGFIAPSSREAPDTSGDHMTETQRISQ